MFNSIFDSINLCGGGAGAGDSSGNYPHENFADY